MGDRPRSAACPAWVSLETAGFRTLLQAPVIARSAHFVVHHQATLLRAPAGAGPSEVVQNLSTESGSSQIQSVDNLSDLSPAGVRVLGVMVPKRHAKRSVTRSLVKRQARAAVQGLAGLSGVWLVRLKQPINLKRYPSAASEALRTALHAELAELMLQVARSGAARVWA